MTAPTVSVVMPVRDAAASVEEAAKSILSQTLTDLELVIVDDGSTDGTPQILERLRSQDDRVVLIASAGDGGTARARNAGCASARGRYLARMDADDLSLPERLQHQVQLLDANPSVGLVGGQMTCASLDGLSTWPATYPTDDAAIRVMAQSANPFGGTTVTMRREVFEACGGHREVFPYAEDYDLWMRMLERCQGANLAETVAIYTVHLGQTTFRAWRQHCLEKLAVEAALRMRRADGHDPLDRIQLITEDVVRQLGVSEERLRTRLVESLLSLAELAARFNPAERDRLLEAAEIEARCAGVPRELCAKLHLAKALAAFEQRAPARGTASLTKSLRADSGPARRQALVWLWHRHRWVFRGTERLQQLRTGRAG